MELTIGLSIVLGYIVGALFFIGWSKAWPEKRKFGLAGKAGAMLAAFLLTFFVIPLGDHAAGYAHYSYRCNKEGGTNIVRTVPQVEGLRLWYASGERTRDLGYRFLEEEGDNENLTRYEVSADQIVVHKGVKSISAYAFVRKIGEPQSLWMARHRQWIEKIDTKQALAMHTSFDFLGGWMVRALLAGFGGRAAACHIGLD